MKLVLLCDEVAELVNDLRCETDDTLYNMRCEEIVEAMCDYISGYEGTVLSERDASRYKSAMECFYHHYQLIAQLARSYDTE